MACKDVSLEPAEERASAQCLQLDTVIATLRELLEQQRHLVAVHSLHFEFIGGTFDDSSKPTFGVLLPENDTMPMRIASGGTIDSLASNTANISDSSDPGTRTVQITKKGITMMLEEAAWEHAPSGIFTDSGALPTGIPSMISVLLLFSGVLSQEYLKTCRFFRVYQFYRYLIGVSALVNAVFLSALFCVYVQLGYLWYAILYLSVIIQQMFILIPAWLTWVQEFGSNGATLELMRQMHRRGFKWESVTKFTLRFVFVFSFVAFLPFFLLQVRYHTSNLDSEVVDILGEGFLRVHVFTSPFRWLWVFLTFSQVFLVRLTGSLYQYDLVCYAHAMAQALSHVHGHLEEDDLHLLMKMETTITRRLYIASNSWVRLTVLQLLYASVISLVLCVLLIMRSDLSVFAISFATLVIILSLIIARNLLYPMAEVAETYDAVVLRELNNPNNLRRAQQYFGQQLLAHLNMLDWGFRVGGTVITHKLLAQITMAVLITLTTASTKALTDLAYANA